jgi:hypothetical protein
MKHVRLSLKTLFSDVTYSLLALSLSINLALFYYLVFLQTTTLTVFFLSNNAFYNWTAILLTLVNSLFFGIAVSLTILAWKKRKMLASASTGNSLLGAVFGVISTSCPVCGSVLLPVLGIAGSLAAFPLQGLEIKALSIFLLALAINESSKTVAGICSTGWNKKMILISGLAILLVYALPRLPAEYKLSFANQGNFVTNNLITNSKVDSSELFAQVNPVEGYTTNVVFGDIGPKLLKVGAIDLDKFIQTYERADRPLSKKQIEILTQGSDEKISINKDNAYFLINLFWALGLANKNPILDEGPMTKYGGGQIGSFASTGGWTIGKREVMDIYSRSRLIALTPEQQAIVDEAASNTYRPCCGNPTSFPDCNHGMAMLGLFELMASQGATLDELFEAAKYFNAFWFPQQYLDIATYFKAKEGKNFDEIDPRLIVSNEFSSGGGWSKTRKWLANNNLIKKAPSGGGGCGV